MTTTTISAVPGLYFGFGAWGIFVVVVVVRIMGKHGQARAGAASLGVRSAFEFGVPSSLSVFASLESYRLSMSASCLAVSLALGFGPF